MWIYDVAKTFLSRKTVKKAAGSIRLMVFRFHYGGVWKAEDPSFGFSRDNLVITVIAVTRQILRTNGRRYWCDGKRRSDRWKLWVGRKAFSRAVGSYRHWGKQFSCWFQWQHELKNNEKPGSFANHSVTIDYPYPGAAIGLSRYHALSVTRLNQSRPDKAIGGRNESGAAAVSAGIHHHQHVRCFSDYWEA